MPSKTKAELVAENAALREHLVALQAKWTAEQCEKPTPPAIEWWSPLIAESRHDLVCLHDLESRYLAVSPAVYSMLGYTSDELLGRRPSDFFHPDDVAAVLEPSRQRVRDGQSTDLVEFRFRAKDGGYRWVQSLVRPILDTQGRLIYHLSISRDIASRKSAEEALQHRTQQLGALRSLGEEITRELDLVRLLELITRRAAELVAGSSGGVYLWDEESQQLFPHVYYGASAERMRFPRRRGEGLTGNVVRERRGIIINDYRSSPFAHPKTLQSTAITAALAEPLLYRDRLLGVIAVHHEIEGLTFSQSDQEILRLFAPQAAIAIENARLYDAVLRRAEQFATLNNIARTLTTTLDPQQVAEQILKAVRILLPEAAIRLWEHGPEEGLFRHLAGIGLTPRAAPEVVRFPPGDGLMGLALQTRQPVISRDVRTDERFRETARARADGLVSGLILPLLARDRVCGILAIFTPLPHEFSPEELDLFGSFAAQAAVALENARLYAELKRAYDDVRHAQDELVRSEKLRAVGQLGAGMAHDLNNVLAVILGQVELLKLRTTDPDTLESLRTLETSATDGAEVVRRVQDFARPRGGSPLVAVDLPRLVAEALEITRPRWKDEPDRRGIRIEVRSTIPALPPVLGHAPEIREALINLIFNAVDAMPQGGTLSLSAQPRGRGSEGARERQNAGEPGGSDGESPDLPLPPSAPHDWVELAVSDTGVGMSPEVRARIFEPFFSTKGVQGTGLGLSVVYGIMERHDGRIDVESVLGGGTTIRLTFHTSSEAPNQPTVRTAAVAPKRLLLIDDELVVRQTLGSLLRSVGHTVVEAEGGAEGLAQLPEAAPDLVLTDLGMPEMTGWEVAAAIKKMTPSLPVVLLTGWGDQAAETESAPSVDRILGKPIRLDDLLGVIGELTGSPRA